MREGEQIRWSNARISTESGVSKSVILEEEQLAVVKCPRYDTEKGSELRKLRNCMARMLKDSTPWTLKSPVR